MVNPADHGPRNVYIWLVERSNNKESCYRQPPVIHAASLPTPVIGCAAVMWDAAAICKKIGDLKQQACLISRVSPSPAPTVA
jgi:hypothetical protein